MNIRYRFKIRELFHEHDLAIEVRNDQNYDSIVKEIKKTMLANWATEIMDKMEIDIIDIENPKLEFKDK